MNSAANVIRIIGSRPPELKYQTRQISDSAAAEAFRACPPGSLVAAEDTLPASLP